MSAAQKKKNKVEVLPKLTEFVMGETSFVSNGVVELKLTVDGKEKILPVPIKSIGVIESQEAIDRNRPQPPSKLETIKKNSEAGRLLGLEEDEIRRVTDYADADFVAQMRQHTEKMLWAAILPGLDVMFKDTAGKTVDDPAVKRAALEGAGITGHHLDELAAAIRDLTKKSERTADFLSGNGSG